MLSPRHATVGARLSPTPEHGEHALNIKRLAVLITAGAMALSLAAPVGAASPNGKADSKAHKSDNLQSAAQKKQAKLKQTALNMVLKGQAKPAGKNKVVKVAKGQYVELAFEGEDQILTLLGQFGNGQPTHNHGALGSINHHGTDGPLHNRIPEPDRSVDNTTIWAPDFSQSYYDNLLYNKTQNPSMANWYLEQSYGRYSVDGYVSDWVNVPNNEAAYGSNYCGSIVCTRDIGRFIEDQADTWWPTLVAQTGSVANANAFLATFDIWDRYDFDGDGNFNEPDGYIDHFQSVHAGEGEETGGGAQGTDAIWSHRSAVNSVPFGADGPVVGGVANKFGGAHIGDSNYWIYDYTIEPENGGVGVFSHEFGHDLGLPDEYDTSGNTGGAENSTAWWTPWSQGSYGSVNGIDLGSAPVDATQWERIVLGWSNYEVAFAGESSAHKLSASEVNTKQAQALVVVLPDKQVSKDVGTPWLGSNFYHSGSGNDLDNTMTKAFTLGAGTITASFSARYHIEPCWDYAYLQVSTDGGTTFTNVHTSVSDDPVLNVNNQNFGEGISGVSGTTLACDDVHGLDPTPTPVNVTANLSAFAGKSILLRFRYWTDGATAGDGFGWDNLAITTVSNPAVDDAEADYGWDFDGFVRTNGTVTSAFANYYIAEYRTYRGYDLALQKGPYQFTDPNGNWVEHFPYQDGLLIWYYDTSQADNNVGDHPGEGLILPIDAHPDIRHWSDGTNGRPRLQSYDSTFGLDRTEAITVHSTVNGTFSVPSMAAAKTFNDNLSYYRASDPADAKSFYKAAWSSVNHPHTNTVIKVASDSATGFMQVIVNP
jgi:immune inhibitor A